MPLLYKTGSLFDAPKDSVLVHACNAQGVWGSGIAKEFKLRFPNSYELYHHVCLDGDAAGAGIILPKESEYMVGCLLTSRNYALKRDSVEEILKNTRSALTHMLEMATDVREIHSCKFNAGLFAVPWEETEKVLLDVVNKTGYNKDWTIWTLPDIKTKEI